MVDESLEKFRLEYEKLHRALKKSHEQEKRLVKKCRELNSEILNNQAKIKTALRLSQEDQKTITHLQKEMEKTWKLGNTNAYSIIMHAHMRGGVRELMLLFNYICSVHVSRERSSC